MLYVEHKNVNSEGIATINFKIGRKDTVTIDIFNDIGSLIATLLNEVVEPGKQQKVELNTEQLTEGTYYAIIQTNIEREIVKMVVNKAARAC